MSRFSYVPDDQPCAHCGHPWILHHTKTGRGSGTPCNKIVWGTPDAPCRCRAYVDQCEAMIPIRLRRPEAGTFRCTNTAVVTVEGRRLCNIHDKGGK